MKKILLIICMSLGAFALRADERSEDILRKMAGAFSSYKSYEVSFTATMEDEFQDMRGNLVVSGEKYRMFTDDTKIWFDGKVRYNYSVSNEEVILESPDPKDNSIFSSPTSMFNIFGRDFTSVFMGTVTESGKNIGIIQLTPKHRNTGFDSILLRVDLSTSLPVAISYDLSDYGKKMELNVLKFIPNVATAKDTFIFNRSAYPHAEVIDFR